MHWRLCWGEWLFSSQFSLHSPLISWSQIWHEGGARFCRMLLCGSVGCSSIGFPPFLLSPLVWSFLDVDCADECWPSDSQVTMTPISLPDNVSLLSSSVTADLLCLGRSFTWQCAIDQHCLRTDHLINLSFAKSGDASAVQWLDPDRFPNLVYVTSDFRRRRFGVYAFHALLILVYAICWPARWRFIIFGCRIIPHSFHYRATWPCGYSLDSAVTLLHIAVTFQYISTQVSYSYAPFICESKETLATKSWGIIRQYFSWHIMFKENTPHFLHDVPAGTTQWNLLACNWSASRIHCDCNGLCPYQADTSCLHTSILPFSH